MELEDVQGEGKTAKEALLKYAHDLMLVNADVGELVFGCAQGTREDYNVSPPCRLLIKKKISLKHIALSTLTQGMFSLGVTDFTG